MNKLQRMAVAGVVAVAAISVGTVAAGTVNSEFLTKAYITVGSNVVVLPQRLAQGDRITITDARGVRVFERTVSNTSMVEQGLNLGHGLYTLTVTRKGSLIAFVEVPM